MSQELHTACFTGLTTVLDEYYHHNIYQCVAPTHDSTHGNETSRSFNVFSATLLNTKNSHYRGRIREVNVPLSYSYMLAVSRGFLN